MHKSDCECVRCLDGAIERYQARKSASRYSRYNDPNYDKNGYWIGHKK